MTFASRLVRRLSAGGVCLAGLLAFSAQAHMQEFAWNENTDGTIDFYGSSYHGNLASASSSGLVLDGAPFNFTSYTAISDAAWSAFLADEADGFQFIENFSSVDGYGAFTLSLSDISALGWSAGANVFTASVFSSGSEFLDVHGNGTEYVNTVVRTAAVPEPASLALMAIGLVGLGFARKTRRV